MSDSLKDDPRQILGEAIEAAQSCDVCGFPLAQSKREGCVPGDCSMRPVPKCWICGKRKGQPPDRCPGHYEGTPRDPKHYKRGL